MKSIVTLFILALVSSQQPAGKFDLTVDNIMKGPDLVGYEPTLVKWSQDSQRVYFHWKRAGEPRLKETDVYVVGVDGTGLRKLSEDEARLVPPAIGEISKDKRSTIYAEDGDLYLYDNGRGDRRQITRTTDTESNPHFTRDQKHVTFMRQNNLFVLSLDDGSLVQVTDIRAAATEPAAGTLAGAGGGGGGGGGGFGGRRQGGAAAATGTQQQRGTESQEYVKQEERELLDAVKERAQQREEQEAKRKKRETRKPYTLASGQSVVNLTLSPDGKQVVASILQQATGSKSTVVPNYVTESGYTEDIQGRTKVGDAQGRTRIALIQVETGEVKWVDHGQRAAIPPTRAENTTQPQTTEVREQTRERDLQLFAPQWSDDGTHAVLQARAGDNKDRWILLLDNATGTTKVVAHEHNDAWVDGPGSQTLGWLPDGKRIYFESERDGFAHLYAVSIDGGEPQQLTSGPFEVSDVHLSEDKTKFFFTSNEYVEGNGDTQAGPAKGLLRPFERHLFSMPVGGGARTRITSMPGSNQAVVSPDERMLAVVRSYSNKPPELYLEASHAGAPAKQITTSPIDAFFSYKWIDPPIVGFKARDGVTVYGRIYKPARFARGGPAVVFVHGAGYLQNVHKWWSQYYREYMFHHLLMEKGFLVFDIDYRGSAGYGRDWRTAIYRHMGGADLTDQVDAAKYLAGEYGVDAKRIGIYGGSYGGFITLMALFTEPDVFRAGAALRPVTDWAHYNHGYTANILNAPQSDKEAYERSSPIFFANGLKGSLLICHGMVDTNVHFQDTVRLVEKLIELHKENWELAVYPVEDHGFERASSWSDEYRRILKLFETNLK
jgi:Tol biopolymer transport system component/acetyl esterase/lipase